MYRFYLIILLFILCSPVAQSGIVKRNNIYSTAAPAMPGLLHNKFGLTDTINSSPINSKTNNYPYRNHNAGENFENKAPAGMFVKVTINKQDCYVGESILVTYKLYSRVNSKSKITKQPRLEGFSVYDLFDMISIAESNDTIMGIPYKVHTIRKARLVPLQTGSLDLDPIELENTVHYTKSDGLLDRSGNHLNDVINKLLKEETAPSTERLVTIKSKPVSVTVKALPELHRPLNFAGAVGRFTIRASLSKQNPVLNEVDTLRIELQGNGNWRMIDSPEIQWPPNVESIAVRTVAEPGKDNITLEGKRIFEYSFIPTKTGKFTIPNIGFSFFDPAVLLYQTIHTPAMVFEAGIKSSIVNTQQGLNLFVVPKTSKTLPINYFNSYAKIILVLLFLSGFLIFMSKKKLFTSNKRFKTDVAAVLENDSKTTATSEVQIIDPLLVARGLAENPNYAGFYTALQTTLWNLFSEKFHLQPTTLNKSNILYKLRLQGWNDENIDLLNSILTECERTLYLPGYQSFVHPRDQVRKAETIVAGLQNL